MKVMLFHLNNDIFAINIEDIDEIIMMAAIKKVPGSPSFINGILNLWGAFLPVIDLSNRLGFQRPKPPPPLNSNEPELTPYTKETRIIIVQCKDLKIGMIVDNIKEILEVGHDDIRENVLMEDARPDYIDGIIINKKELVQIVHVKQIIDEEELAMIRNT